LPETIRVFEKWREINGPFFVLAGGTNVLFGDDCFEGLVFTPDFQEIKKDDDSSLRVGVGVLMEDLVSFFEEKGFSGLEWAGGLPGTLGGAIRGNAGAFGGEIKDVVKEVTSFDVSSGDKTIRRKNNECDFSYRNSIFKKQSPTGINPKEIIIEVVLDLKKGDKKLIREIVQKNVFYRKERQPIEYPNIGSIFKNVSCEKIGKKRLEEFEPVIKTDPFPVVPVAHLISEAGLKGISCGGAMISPKHPNFIVNVVNASANDVKNLIELVKSEIKNRFEINLEEEIIIFS